jgi:hypothetical protein
MTISTIICLVLFLLGMVLGLVQLWINLWNAELFLKIIVTDGALFVISFVVGFLVKEHKENEKINKGSGLD